MFYFQDRTDVQRIYYQFWKRKGQRAEILPFIGEEKHRYLQQYVLLNEFHRRIHPYQFVREGSTVIQGGFHNGLIRLGTSQPLALSALVGPKGRVLAVEPDDVNINKMNEFTKTNNIKNIKIAKAALWSEEKELKFLFFESTESNMFTATGRKNYGSFCDNAMKNKPIIAKTMDSIVEKHLDGKIDFINLTINGAEYDALKGAEKTLDNNPNVEISLAMKDKKNPLFKDRMKAVDLLLDRGYKMAWADAEPRPWENRTFLFAVATKRSDEELATMKFHKCDNEECKKWFGKIY